MSQPIEGGYNPADFENIDCSADVKDLFMYISRYKPHQVELESCLKPFIPKFIPAVGDIDAFIRVTTSQLHSVERQQLIIPYTCCVFARAASSALIAHSPVLTDIYLSALHALCACVAACADKWPAAGPSTGQLCSEGGHDWSGRARRASRCPD